MTSQGSFPKIDGDVLYASEVNMFSNTSRYISVGSFAQIGSSTATQNIGSFVFGTGSFTNPCLIELVLAATNKAIVDNISIQISGLSTNTTIAIGSGRIIGTIQGQILVGNPLAGFMTFSAADAGTNSATNEWSNAAVTNLHTGSTFVIKLTANPTANLTVNSYMLSVGGIH